MMARRELLAMTAVADVALHARGTPVAAKALAERLGLPPRHLETLLRDLVRAGILKGTRGPRGGYELARERRRISLGDVVRALDKPGDAIDRAACPSPLLERAVLPAVEDALQSLLGALDAVSIEALVQRSNANGAAKAAPDPGGFVI